MFVTLRAKTKTWQISAWSSLNCQIKRKAVQAEEVLTSSYVDVGGDENIKAATLRWYHGSSAKAKHLGKTQISMNKT